MRQLTDLANEHWKDTKRAAAMLYDWAAQLWKQCALWISRLIKKWWKLTVFVSFFGVIILGVAWWCPECWLENTFLKKFISHEIIAILAIVLTVNFGAVVSLHLYLGKIVRQLKAKGRYAEDKLAVNELRAAINSDAWTVFWAFSICFAALVAKGWLKGYPQWDAAMTGVSLVVLLVYGFIFHDIYKATFVLANIMARLEDEKDSEVRMRKTRRIRKNRPMQNPNPQIIPPFTPRAKPYIISRN